MDNIDVNGKLDNISKQFLCCVPIKCFQWNNIFQDVTYELQDILLNKTVNFQPVLKYPIVTSYQKAFLKHIIETLEAQGTEIHDNLYSAYGRLVSLSSNTDVYFKHYYMSKLRSFLSLKENVHLISDGTTGLRTWPASLALSEWVIENDRHFRYETVLELGSGIGLTGLTIAIQCGVSRLYLTDGHPSVLRILVDNVHRNLDHILLRGSNCSEEAALEMCDRIKKMEVTKKRFLYADILGSNVFVLDFPWEDINEQECLNLGPIKIVVAADVVYDMDLFEPLIKAMKSLAAFSGVEQFIFSCTERNPQTIEAFVKRIREESFSVEELPIPSQKHFIWSTESPIKIFRFERKEII